MAEQTQTKKLREKIADLSSRDYDGLPLINNPDKEDHLHLADQILKAGKEEGLMFAKVGVKGDLEGACICKVEEIEI